MTHNKTEINRRQFFVASTLGGLSLTGCKSGPELGTSNESKATKVIKAEPITDLNTANQGFSPQFIDGDRNALGLIEIGWSMHCGGTREWFRQNGSTLVEDIRTGRKVAIFSHVIRSADELNVGVEIMRVGKDKYPQAVYYAIGLSVDLNRPISSQEVKLLLQELGMKSDPNFLEENARVALLSVQIAYREGLAHKETPIILESRIG